MNPQDVPRPTDAELAILLVLWQRGPCTVRQVHEALIEGRPMVYTTVLKLMQIMTDKGLVRRDESERTHVYEVTRTEEETQRQLVDHLLDRAFGGSGPRLAMRALATRRSSPGELAELRQLLDELEEDPA